MVLQNEKCKEEITNGFRPSVGNREYSKNIS